LSRRPLQAWPGTAAPSRFADVDIKRFRRGTHRVASPADTLTALEPVLPLFGITRVANMTGLDRIGIPVVVAYRPNARSLSVSQGKGLTLDAARVSGLMESIECWHAERIALPLRLASASELSTQHRVVDASRLPQLSISRYHDHLRLPWIEGFDVAGGEPVWVPYEMVHLDLTLPLPEGSGCFPTSSNGLASGNHSLEAAVHAVAEVIERDAYALWQYRSPEDRRSRRVDLASVSDAGCRELLDRFESAGMLVGVWEMTTDVAVPAYRCTIVTGTGDPTRPLYPSSGLGCHPVSAVALFRALAEAAQSRLTRISGSRDDVERAEYELSRNPDRVAATRARLAGERGTRLFGAAPTHDAEHCGDDLEWLVDRLGEAGLHQPILVDLTRPELAIPVVRAIVPGLEPKPGVGYVPGRRVRQLVERRAE
jgi:YcaO-like protein with predicted kinase domain